MQILQRMLMVILAAGCLLFLLDITLLYQTERQTNQWRKLYSERFLEQICDARGVQEGDYLLYLESMMQFGEVITVQINEYQNEFDLAGGEYAYMISWQEIKKDLVLSESYVFQEKSIIELVVEMKNGTKIRYYDICMGER